MDSSIQNIKCHEYTNCKLQVTVVILIEKGNSNASCLLNAQSLNLGSHLRFVGCMLSVMLWIQY